MDVKQALRMESPVGAKTIINGRTVDYFAGTGYLGLQSDPLVVQAAVDALQRYGISTATSRGSYGEHPVYDDLEREACAYFGAEKVLYYPSGYQGAAILTQATGTLFDHIFIDNYAHYNQWDAAQATNQPISVFHHLEPGSLEEVLRRELQPNERPLVLSDGIFPISGEVAPLPDYLALVKPLGGQVYLDDAHAVGVLGENGRGTPEYYGIQDDACRTAGTLAKALGGFGGLIWGESRWIDSIDRNSRLLAGASPPPLPVAAASASALKIARENPGLRRQLRENLSHAREGLRALGWDLPDSPAPFLCLRARDGLSLGSIRTRLFEQGVAVALIRAYPSTPPGGALRIALFATHTTYQIDHLLQTMRAIME